ncbi:class I SAM-dependent methyltransferase [Sphingomonas sp. SRS2]|uniref:class I SAM-dependent methyltransferase n=1 Tax=Sphingomonas sp. SRS2 TaxID=133190 RepID=UPI000698F846|nr:class I SAM-dependent methyltransferase [Sphingomonas sp. SRS2]
MLTSNTEWEKLAKADPLFHIASVKGMEGGKWEHEAFFAKGETYVGVIDEYFTGKGSALDIGCGAGRISRALAKRFDHVTGVDVAPTMVKLASEMCADVKNAEFKVGEGVRLPAADHSMDAVVSFQVLQHIDRSAIPGLLQECYRIKKPGGVVILHIPAHYARSFIQRWTRLIPARRFLTLAAMALGIEPRSRFWIPNQYHSYSLKTVTGLLRAAGFKDIRIVRRDPGNPLTTLYIAA